MPELPEVESARAVIERGALAAASSTSTTPTATSAARTRAGEIRAALLGRRLTVAHRRGKSMWCETSAAGRERTPGPTSASTSGCRARS